VMLVTFVRTWYFAGISNFYAIYRMEILGESLSESQVFVFVFMMAAAVGTLFGGAMGDRWGHRNVLFFTVFISAPLAFLLPYTEGLFTYFTLAFLGAGLLASFSVSLIYCMQLLPGQVGKVSGLIFGVAFGLSALGSLVLGKFSDLYGIAMMMNVCSFIPILGVLAYFLPRDQEIKAWYAPQSSPK
jgi:MFS transporter, FSR family, fosmidomycin resistance protein